MRKVFTLAITGFLLFPAAATINLLMPVDAASKVKFTIKNFGIATSGTFHGLTGNIKFNPEKLSESFFDVSIDATTIATGIKERDKHLKKKNYFNVAQYPRISFVSSQITRTNNAYTVKGKLTIKNITREISFPFIIAPQPTGYIFTGNFSINRRDFTVGNSSLVLGENVAVYLTINAK